MKKSLLFVFCGLLLLTLLGCQGDPGLLHPNSAIQVADGSIYVLDFGHQRIVQLNSDGKILQKFGGLGESSDQLFRSWDLTLGTDGNLYLGNFVEEDIRVKSDSVKVFTLKGEFIQEIGREDYAASGGEERLARKPYGLEIDNAGYLYVADYLIGTARVFTLDGEFVTTLFTDLPEGLIYVGLNDIAIDDTRGLLYTVDFDNNRLDQYHLTYDNGGVPQVEFIQTVAKYGHSNKTIAFPQYITVSDETGYLYVGDTGNRRVQVFDSQGEHVTHFAAPDVNEWQIMGISLGNDDNLYVTDAYNNTIWAFSAKDGTLQRRIEVSQ